MKRLDLRHGLAPLSLIAIAACIEPQQVVSPADLPDAAPDVPAADTGGEDATDVAGEDLVSPSCEELACASTASACEVATCREGRCVVEPTDGWCTPDALCTGAESAVGVCIGGQCVVQSAGCESEPTKGCVVPVCGPGGDCVPVPVEGGYCVASTAKDFGACSGNRMNPIDICDAAGACTNRGPGSASLPDAGTLGDGKWWVVSQRLGALTARMFASRLDFDTDGTFSSERFGRELGDIGVGEDRGTFCLDPAGGLAIGLRASNLGVTDELRLIGQVARESEAFVASSASGREVMVGIPLGTDRTLMNGPYEAILTRAADDGGIDVWRGTMTFSNGELEDIAQFEGSDGGFAAFAPDGSEFGSRDSATGLFPLTLARQTGESSTDDEEFVGAISPDGRLALVAAVDAEDKLGFGMLFLIRIEGGGEAMPETPDRGAWYAASHGPGDSESWPAVGAIFVTRGDRVLQGLHGDGGDIWTSTRSDGRIRGGQLAWDEIGRLGVELRFGGTARYYSGFLAPARDLGFVVGVAERRKMTLGPSFSGKPVLPEFAFIVRRNE